MPSGSRRTSRPQRRPASNGRSRKLRVTPMLGRCWPWSFVTNIRLGPSRIFHLSIRGWKPQSERSRPGLPTIWPTTTWPMSISCAGSLALQTRRGACAGAEPMDGSNVWFVGLMLAYMGEWDRGCALAERAMELNPHYPGKYGYPLVYNLYRKGDYKGALSEALRLNMPDLFYTP